MSRFVIDDAMWEKLEQMLPSPKGRHGKDDRLFLEAVCWVIRTGAPWRDLPPEYGKVSICWLIRPMTVMIFAQN